MRLTRIHEHCVRRPLLDQYIRLLSERASSDDARVRANARIEIETMRALREAEQTRRISPYDVSPLTLVQSLCYLEDYPAPSDEDQVNFVQLVSYYKSFPDIRDAFRRPLRLPKANAPDRTTQLRYIVRTLGDPVARAIVDKYERLTAGSRTDAERIADETYFYALEDAWLTETATALLRQHETDPYAMPSH